MKIAELLKDIQKIVPKPEKKIGAQEVEHILNVIVENGPEILMHLKNLDKGKKCMQISFSINY